jgi:hypothetical protein
VTSDPDLFDDLPPPSGPRIPDPTEDEITEAIEQTIDEDGICLPRSYVRDMLAGRDPTDPAQRTGPHTCGNCGNCFPSRFVGPNQGYCDRSLLTVDKSSPPCLYWTRRPEAPP